MKTSLLILSIALFLPLMSFGQQAPAASQTVDNHHFPKAQYLLPSGEAKGKPQHVDGTLMFDPDKKDVAFLQGDGRSAVTIPYDAIKTITYEKATKPRYAEAVLLSPAFLLSPAKKHYLTFEYADNTRGTQYAIIHLDKTNARQAVYCAEVQTGKKVERIEETK